MLKLDLPTEPVDRYTVPFWSLSISEHWYYIKPMAATYYVNTTWEEYSPGDARQGAPLRDDWMLSENGHGTGRIPGWANLTGRVKGWYPTRQDAVDAALAYYKKCIATTQANIARMERYIVQLKVRQHGPETVHGEE